MKRPTAEKFIYDLHSPPSCLKDYNTPADIRKFRLNYESIIRKHKKWLRNNVDAHHSCPPTKYPLTSGELSMLQLQDEKFKKRKKIKTKH